MDMLQERSLMIGYIRVISWDMQLQQDLFSTGKPDQPFVVTRSHNVWFGEYNSRLSIEDNHTPGYLILCQYPEGRIHESDLLNLIPCELDLTSTPFSDTTIMTYEIELPPSGNKVYFILLHDEDFTIAHITDTIPNTLSVLQVPSQAKRNLWIIAFNGEELITAQGVLDEINRRQNPRGKSNIKIILCRRKI